MSNTIFNINSNKCGCTVQSYTEIKPCLSKNDECCLILCNILTGKDIYPCGIGNTSGNLDITSYIKIPKCCDETTILTNIPYHSNNLKDVSLIWDSNTKTFILNYTSNYSLEENNNYKDAEIIYEISCGLLQVQAQVIIPFKQYNENPNCSYGYNPCTGECLEPKNEISISDLPNNNEIRIQ